MPPTPVTVSVHPAHAGSGKGRFGRHNTVAVAPRVPPAPPPQPAAPPPTANQKRKMRVVTPLPTPEHLSSTMVPQNVTIVARCLARVTSPSPPTSAKKRSSHHHTPTASPGPTGAASANPYSRTIDLANTRSTVPSPQELARAERAEEEKARQKKENAAAARAAAALARRRKALRSGRGSRTPSASVAPATMIPPIQRAVARERARSAEAAAARAQADALTLPTSEPEDGGSNAGSLTSRALKRTRSSGIATNGAGTVANSSPLRTVSTAPDDVNLKDGMIKRSPGDDDAPTRKRSRLAESSSSAAVRNGAPSTSPAGSTTSLPDKTPAARIGADAMLSPAEPMRRVVSAQDTTGMRATRSTSGAPRNASVGPESTRERSRRDTQPPVRMRDYDR